MPRTHSCRRCSPSDAQARVVRRRVGHGSEPVRLRTQIDSGRSSGCLGGAHGLCRRSDSSARSYAPVRPSCAATCWRSAAIAVNTRCEPVAFEWLLRCRFRMRRFSGRGPSPIAT